MENQQNHMGLVETILLDALFLSIFIIMLFIAITCPAPDNLVAIDLPLVFGGVTFPFARTFSKWLIYLRFQENTKIAAKLNLDPVSNKWLFIDFGEKEYTWMFRIISSVTAAASIYHLITYIIR